MITEESIKQTRFYRGIDGKFYFVSEVEEVKVVTLIDCYGGEESILVLGDRARESNKFDPVKPTFQNKQITTAGPSPSAKLAGRKKPRKKGPRKNSTTGFTGVKEEKPYSDGRKRFTANYRKDGKYTHIGTFENVYLAAAAVQEKKGDHTEAQRLRDMAEQANNNLDRTRRQKRIKKWICKRCGSEYKKDPRELEINCGHDDFREIPA